MLKLGISEIVYTLINNVELRPDCNVIISRSTAYDFLSESRSEIESITAKYYEIIATSSKYTGYTSNINIANVFDRITDTFGEACASSSSKDNATSASGESNTDTDTIAGETTSNSGSSNKPSSNIDVVGLAVFKDDMLVRRTFWC